MDLQLFSIKRKNDYWGELSRHIKKKNRKKIRKSFDFAKLAHQGQKRVSGLDFISHPVWVAKVVVQFDMGVEAVQAALLHDCVEDTKTTVDEIADKFGDEVALLVDGLTEVKRRTKGIKVHQTSIEVFKRFLFSSVDDVRILMIRLVDKLHNGLTIKYLSASRQEEYARRVFGIYGPIAEYVGMHYFKRKLDDISFKILYPKESKKLEIELLENKKNELKALEAIKTDMKSMLKINHLNGVEVQGRIKSLYSTFLKIKKKGLDGVKDRVGIRVLAENIGDCYVILGLLHAKYPYIDAEFDDYVSTPKLNGYRSLQTTLNWKKGLTVEVQIRTFEMHEFNEFGPASHIAYKYGQGKTRGGYRWVKDLLKWQRGKGGVKNYRIKVLTDYIYVFTPKGDTIQLPSGCSGLDFAYRIHSGLGDRCKGIMINGKIAKIKKRLETGDVVEVLTSKKINANESWLKLAKTTSARAHIRRAIQQ